MSQKKYKVFHKKFKKHIFNFQEKPQESILYTKMTIIKKKIFLCTTAIHTGQERDHGVGLKKDTESVSNLPIKIKWIIVSEINTE